jgi:hypothetical protein
MEKRQPQAEPVNVAEFRKLAADALVGDVLDHLDGGACPASPVLRRLGHGE